MTDVLTEESTTTEDNPRKPRAPRRPAVPVTYTIEAIPEPPASGAGRPRSPVHEHLAKIADPNQYPLDQWYVIAVYPSEDDHASTSASAKAADLRKRYTQEDGWEFRVGDHEGSKVVAVKKSA